MNITLSPVKSSNISAVGYDAPSRTMRVQFKGGGMYDYAGVPEATHREFMGADSKGQHFRAFIVGQYQHQRVAGES